MMHKLSLDFNRLDDQGRVRLGPAAAHRHMPTLAQLRYGDRVLVVDDEGDQCEGVIEDGPIVYPNAPAWLVNAVVRLDMATWRDAPDAKGAG